MLPDTEERGPAADTGTAVGRMIELWHRGVDDAERRARGEMAEFFPAAKMDVAGTMFVSYTSDPRNQPSSPYGEVIPDSLEAEVTGHITDPVSGTRIELTGHMDQARYCPDGVVRVWDVKSGGKGQVPNAYVAKYTWQIAAYVVALDETRPPWLGDRPVEAGGIILLSAYPTTARAKILHPDAVFQSLGIHDVDSCRLVLGSAAWLLALAEGGTIPIFPGPHCTYCPGGSPPGCLSLLRQM